MQVYGDTSSEILIATFAGDLLARISDRHDLASLRAALIACGQLEQLVWDANGADEALRLGACRATDHAAAAFYAVWSVENSLAPPVGWRIADEMRLMRSHLMRLAVARNTVGTLKLPEGFAFYAVYPEQYCAAAVASLPGLGAGQGMKHVIGLRSIGTTLSAAVAVVLRAANIAHRRYTVRPHGHPFERQLELPEPFAIDDCALVVDEGPGLSGSSFFSAARALTARGVSATRQIYVCAHPQPPGPMASPEIGEFWRQAKRYVASSYDPAISSAGPLSSTIQAEIERQFGSRVLGLEDVSRGRWRASAFREPRVWPAAYATFERPKLLAELANGRRVLLKFYGQVLRADPVTRRTEWSDAAAVRQFARSVSPTAQIHGYIARYWVEGELLTVDDKSPVLLEELASFVARRAWSRACEGQSATDAYYGATGALAPQEWLKSPDGSLRKLPETLPNYDHTAVGAQPLGWDLAAAIVEWRLSTVEIEQLLARFRAYSGIDVDGRDLPHHVARYASFNAEKARFCASQTAGEDSLRLETESLRYAAYENGVPT
jgi:hypothetical protein